MNRNNFSLSLMLSAACLLPAPGAAGEAHGGGKVTLHPEHGFYISGGYSYYAEHFPGRLGHVIHNTSGFSVRGGYRVSEYISLEALFQYYDEFRHRRDVSNPEWWYLVSETGLPESEYLETVTVSGYDITVSAKAYLPVSLFRPYGTIGLGWGRSELKVTEEEYAAPATTYSGTEIWTGCLGRVGVGCDLHVIGGLGLTAEVAYNGGFGDLDTLRFVSLSAGVYYLF
ncbi:MAG: outer membrane beta-barrel protein [PVC group bacterium]